MMPGRWKAYGLSHRGLVRPENEDAFHCDPVHGLLVVADGMGGHHGGAEASRLAVHAIAAYYSGQESLEIANPEPAQSLADIASRLQARECLMQERARAALSTANAALAASSAYELAGDQMGTTVVSVVLHGDHLYGASIGDSRAYLIGNGTFRRLSRDHTLSQARADQGEPEDRSEDGNALLAFLGSEELAEPSFFDLTAAAGSRLLMCTDGLTDAITEPEIAIAVERSPTVGDACQTLLNLALQAGGFDNVTVLVAEFEPTDAEHSDLERSLPAHRPTLLDALRGFSKRRPRP